jgi:hypothetical protein
MDDRANDDVARGRWLAITVTRIAGVVMVVVGIFGLQGVIEYPDIAAYVLIGVGLVDIFVIPQLMARKWRSPRE